MLTCAIVDAYGPGMHFVPLLKEQGYNCIHIQSSQSIPAPFRDFIENAGFIANIVYENNLDNVITILRNNNVTCIIPGFETGVIAADILSESLGIKTNGTSLSTARRNKSLMMDALRIKNVPTVNYLKTNNLKLTIEWANTKTNYPVVAKPVDSASSEDVYICRDDNELEIACNKIINKTNLMGSTNNEALIQSFLEGTEYVVNSVSCEGKHYITDIWECKKRIVDNRIIYDKEELIHFDGEPQSKLASYIYQVLDALGIKYGSAHSEIILTKNGPILLETGARIGGAVNPQIHKECFGHSQTELNIDAYMNSKSFFEKTVRPYKISKYLYVVMAISRKEVLIKNITLDDNLKNRLPSLRFMRLKKKPGDMLQKTIDLNSSPATIYLASENKKQLESEYQTLLSLVDDGFELQ
jgi:biotin carboxylase